MAETTDIKLKSIKIELTKGEDTLTISPTIHDGIQGISEGSMNLEEILCENAIKFGVAGSTKFEVELFGISTDVKGYTITVTAETTDVDELEQPIEIPIFKGEVDSAKTDNFGYNRNIVAYDKIYKLRDLDITSAWNNFVSGLSNAIPLADIVRHILQFGGFSSEEIDNSHVSSIFGNIYTYPSSSLEQFTKLTFGDIMRMACEVACCFFYITRDGKPDFLSLGTAANITFEYFSQAPEHDPLNIEGNKYEQSVAEFEDYTLKPITGVAVYSNNNDLQRIVELNNVPEGTEVNNYPITGNMFLLNTYNNMPTVVQRMASYLWVLQYTPVKLNLIVSNFAVYLGMFLNTERYSEFLNPQSATIAGKHIVTHQTFSGSLLISQTVESTADGEIYNQDVDISGESQVGVKTSAINRFLDYIELLVSDNDVGSSSFRETAGDIRVELNKLGGIQGLFELLGRFSVSNGSNSTTIDHDTIDTNLITLSTLRPQGNSVSTKFNHEGFIEHSSSTSTNHDSTYPYPETVDLGQIELGYTCRNSDGANATTKTVAIQLRQTDDNGVPGLWLGSSNQNGGLFMRFNTDGSCNLYKASNGVYYELNDANNTVAVFG